MNCICLPFCFKIFFIYLVINYLISSICSLRFFAACITFFANTEVVTVPTPPGTGVITDTTS